MTQTKIKKRKNYDDKKNKIDFEAKTNKKEDTIAYMQVRGESSSGADNKKNELWRHIFSNLIIFGLIVVFLLAPFLISDEKIAYQNDKKIVEKWPYVFEYGSGENLDSGNVAAVSVKMDEPFSFFYVVTGPFIMWLVGIYLTQKFIHGKSYWKLINKVNSPRIQRVVLGFVIFFILTIIELLVSYLSDPTNFTYALDLPKFLAYLPLILITFSIQPAAEEIYFRGYGLQFWQKYSKNVFVLVFLTSLIFALFHAANPETSGGWIVYLLSIFSYGALFAIIAIKDKGIEIPIGAHIANNLSTALVNYKGSALETLPSIFVVQSADFSYISLVFLLIKSAIFYLAISLTIRKIEGKEWNR